MMPCFKIVFAVCPENHKHNGHARNLFSPSLPETYTRIFSRWVAFLHPHSYAQKERAMQGMSNSNLKGKA